jgi:hypothetical protein
MFLVARDAVYRLELARHGYDLGPLGRNRDADWRTATGLSLCAHPIESRHGAVGAAVGRGR